MNQTSTFEIAALPAVVRNDINMYFVSLAGKPDNWLTG